MGKFLFFYAALGFLLYSPIHGSRLNQNCDVAILESTLNFIGNILHEALRLLTHRGKIPAAPMDCTDVQKAGNSKSGVYRIWPLNWETYGSFFVYCDMDTDGGGWTVIQRRGDYGQPEDYFYKTWNEYQMGFGNLTKDFWIGNDKIFSLTNQGDYSIRIDMKDKEGERRYAYYREFWIENERQLYELHLSGYTGNAGDSFTYVNGMKFTTKDKDNDARDGNCAESFKGGWWYRECHEANLNGLYLNGFHKSFADGIEWYHWKGFNYSLPEVDMKIRRA